MTRNSQYRWLRTAFSYLKNFVHTGRGSKQIDDTRLDHPASRQNELDNQVQSLSLVSTVDSNVTATLIGSQRLSSFDLRPLSAPSQASASSKSATRRCRSPCHRFLDSSEETPSSHPSIEDNTQLLSLESDPADISNDDDAGKAESAFNAEIDGDNVPTPRASADMQKYNPPAIVPPTTVGPNLRVNPVTTNLNPIQEVSSTLTVNEPSASAKDFKIRNISEALTPMAGAERDSRHAIEGQGKTRNVDTSEPIHKPGDLVVSNWQRGESSAMAAARAHKAASNQVSSENSQGGNVTPVDLANWKGKEPFRSSDFLTLEKSNQKQQHHLQTSAETHIAHSKEPTEIREEKESTKLNSSPHQATQSTDDPIDESEADAHGHFPREPVSPPPYRPSTPPGMPRFGSPEAMNTDYNALKRDRSFKGIRRSISNRLSRRRQSQGSRDGNQGSRVSSSRQRQEPQQVVQNDADAATDNGISANRTKREKESFFSKISRFFRVRPKQETGPPVDIPPDQDRPVRSPSFTPSRRSSLKRYPKGVIDRAPDGTYVRATFPIRSSGHGVGGGNRL